MRKRVLAGRLFGIVVMAAGCQAKEENRDQVDQTEAVTESADMEQAETEAEPDSMGQLGDDSLFSDMNTYTWQEITVSIPDDWEGKYQVREYEDGFELIQTASDEK